jgi:hypothetical protein
VTSVKLTVLWAVVSCSQVQVCRCFGCSFCFRHQGRDDEGEKHLSNVGELLPDYAAHEPRRQPSSGSI